MTPEEAAVRSLEALPVVTLTEEMVVGLLALLRPAGTTAPQQREAA